MSEIISSNEDDINKLVSNFQTQSLKREIELLDEKLHLLDSETQAKIKRHRNKIEKSTFNQR